MAQPSPIHSWKRMVPWVVSAVKSGAVSLMRKDTMVLLSIFPGFSRNKPVFENITLESGWVVKWVIRTYWVGKAFNREGTRTAPSLRSVLEDIVWVRDAADWRGVPFDYARHTP